MCTIEKSYPKVGVNQILKLCTFQNLKTAVNDKV